jgi:hypothetical protein
VQLPTPEKTTPAGRLSVIIALLAGPVPVLATVRVYITTSPLFKILLPVSLVFTRVRFGEVVPEKLEPELDTELELLATLLLELEADELEQFTQPQFISQTKSGIIVVGMIEGGVYGKGVAGSGQ